MKMRDNALKVFWALAGALVLSFLVLGPLAGQSIHRNGFETRVLGWSRDTADAPFLEAVHRLTDQTSHSGQYSEHIQLTAEKGSFIYYQYPTSRAPIGEELSASVWIKSNRPGAQLLARVVLPHERDPKSLDDRLTTLLRGEQYQLVGRWQRLELRRPVKLATEQQQLMRAELKRDVDFTDAYIDRFVLNVYGGPGATEVWIDDLEVGPVLDRESPRIPERDTARPEAPGTPAPAAPARPPTARPAVVELNQEQLLINGRRFLMLGIRHSDTPLKALRDAGFNTIWLDYLTPPARVEEAVNLGFWVVAALPVTSNDPRLSSPGSLGHEVTHFPAGDALLFCDLGSGLTQEQKDSVARSAQVIRAADPQRLLGGDIWDGFRPYSRAFDLVGVHRWPLMTTLELSQYRDWLNQRRLLARPGTFMWTWVQTHLPDWYTNLVYERAGSAGFSEPIGPQPEQIRLLSYTALAAGCRGLGFWSDRFLADSHQGRDRLLALALLNQELQMLEPMLLTAETPRWIDTHQPEVKAAVLRNDHGILVLPIWMGRGAQFVPGQSAAAKLKIVVPEVPAGAQAWLVSPADVRSLQTERVVGGTLVTVPEFGLTAAIVFTADNSPKGLLVHLQDQARRTRKLAAQWNHDLAQAELGKVTRVEEELEQMGHTLPDGKALLDNARARLRTCEESWDNGAYREAHAEAERVMRPLRIMMRAQWEQALRGLTTPVASPYALSFFTLPRHWRFMQQVLSSTPAANVLPDGDFESAPDRAPEAWTAQQVTLDDVEMGAQRVSDDAKEGSQCLMLQIKPRQLVNADGKAALPPAALERTFLAINSPAVRLQPGTLVRISGWVRVPEPIAASADGALFYDNAGGEPLAVRLRNKLEWTKIVVYRQVPVSGTLNVTLALTGLGKVYFDDLRMEPLLPAAAPGSEPLRPDRLLPQARN